MNKLLEFFTNPKTGKFSTSKSVTFIYCIFIIVSVAYLTYINNGFPIFDEGMRWLTAIMIGGRIGNKVVDSKASGQAPSV